MIDRRHFLIGAGALLTASFVTRAKAFSRRSGKPLVLSPSRRPEETLYVYRQDKWNDYCGEWRVTLGPDQPFAPPPPTWREHLRSLGHPLQTHDEIERACGGYGLPVDDLDALLDGFGWRTDGTTWMGHWRRRTTCSRTLILGRAGSALRQAGQIMFEEFGGSPANSFTWVELRDDLTVSLLQARLIELNLPINVAVGTRD